MTTSALAQLVKGPESASPSRPIRGLGTLAARLGERIRLVPAERWWLLLFLALFLVYFVALLFQPAIGRGGR